ncbi:unnamed protein product, partial [Owenia fusiformis]
NRKRHSSCAEFGDVKLKMRPPNVKEQFMITADVVIPTLWTLSITLLYLKGKLSKAVLLGHFTGSLIGCTWELTWKILGDDFLKDSTDFVNPIAGWYTKILHSLWDGGIFLIGVLLCYMMLQKRPLFLEYSAKEFLVMLIWGQVSSFIVESMCNGVIWEYQVLPWNPAYLTVGGVSYTVIPQAVWLVAPLAFYSIWVPLFRKFGHVYYK